MHSRYLATALACCLYALAGRALHAQIVAHAGSDVIICSGTAATLGGTVATGGTGPYTYTWTPATGLNDAGILHPICTATNSQTYTLTATDALGVTGTDQVSVTTLPAADAGITSSGPFTVFNGVPTFYKCSAQASSFFNFNFDGTAMSGAVHTINWGDGTPDFTATGTTWATQGHTYAQGIYTLTYTIVQPNGCNSTRTYAVFLGSTPAVGIGSPGNTSGCGPFSITFPITGAANNTAGTIYTVTFNDGSPPQTFSHPPPATITHLFATTSCGTTSSDGLNSFPNSFQANLTAENPCGTSAGSVVPIVVSTTPTSGFIVSPNDTVCTNSSVTFTSTSTGVEIQGNFCSSSPALLWDIQPATGWSLTTGSRGNANGYLGANWDPSSWTSGSVNLGVSFNIPGSYAVRLRSGSGCGGDTLVRTICVEAPPLPAFILSPTTGCTPLVSTVDNSSTSPNSCFTRYNWLATTNSAACGGSATATFSGGTNASTFEPQFTFTGAGSYTVTLQAINSCGSFPVNVPVTVGAPPQVSVNPVTGICAGQTVSPAAVSAACGSPITTYGWLMPGGVPSSAATQNPGVISYPGSGNFSITAMAVSACGTSTSIMPISVMPLPAAPAVGGPITLCVGETLNLSATPVAGITFHWTGPNGFNSYLANPSIPNMNTAGQGVYTVTAMAGGCEGPPSTITVTVNPPLVVSILPTVPTVCSGEPITLTASGATTYQWTVGGVPFGSSNPFTFTPTATTTVVLTGDDGTCTGATSTQVTVYQLPIANAGGDRVFCESSTVEVLFPGTAGGVWSGDPNVTADGHFTPLAQGVFQLSYTVTSPQGCQSTDMMTVTVNPPATPADAGPDNLLCQNAAPIQLTGTPGGGTWTGDVSIGGMFTPGATGNFVVHYTVGVGSCTSNDSAVVTVVPATALNAGADQQVCIDEPAFALAATPLGGTWAGVVVNGGDFDPAMAGAGAHALTYTYVNLNGCVSTALRTITVNPLPVVQAGSDATFCDQPFVQNLTGSSPSGGTWTGTDVTPSGSFTPNGPGTFMLTYAFTDGNGCSASDSMVVTVITITDPASAGNDTAVCLNSPVLQLAGGPAGGAWSGLHVDAAGAFQPVADGTFTLTYSIGNGSCITLDQVDVTVHPLPVINLPSAVSMCVDAGVQTLAATPLGGLWSGSGITDPALGSFDPAVSGDGTFAVSYAYTDANGCSNSGIGEVTVNPLPTAGFSNGPTACTGVPFPFTDESTDANAWAWDFGDGDSAIVQSPSHAYTAAGTYTVSLTATSSEGCTNSSSHDITVWSGPTVAFDATPTEGCAPLVVNLDNQSFGDGLSFAWDFGDGSTSTDEEPGQHTYYASLIGDTTYTITLAVTNFCRSVDSVRTITVHPAPTALFGPNFDFGCSPWPVTFSNVTIGLADSYLWDFGDGITSTTTDSLVQHTYYTGDTGTTYTISLVATNPCGSDTSMYTITVLPNSITAFFNTDTTFGCAPLTVNFTQYSIGATNWHWDLGDGNVSTAQDVSHTYADAGSYIATLFADNGCSYDTVSVVITVQAPPPADFAIAPGLHCVGMPVQFTNNTPSPAGLAWDFGDGGTSSLSTPTHAYLVAGSYSVTLSVASTLNDCPAVLTQTVNVLATPVAVLTPGPASGCMPLDVQFISTSTNADFLQWDFGDGNTIIGADPLHTFTSPGTYLVQLVAENLNGCTDTTTANVTAFPLPVSAFTQASQESCTAPVNVQLTDASTGAVGHAWDFGNGSTSALNNPVAVFTEPGTFNIQLVVSNQYGCTDSSSSHFIVHPTPVAAFSAAPQPSCAGYPVYFTNLSLNASQFRWEFGDGHVSFADTVSHSYPEGDYEVTLIAIGEGGCVDTTTVPAAVQVNPSPTAAFSYTPMQSTSYALQFHNESEGATSWIWDFGDGGHSSAFEPLHLFPAGPGDRYPFCLIVTNDVGCTDTLCQTVVAVSDPNLFAPNAFTPDGDDVNEDFRPTLNGFENWRYAFYVFDRWGELIHESRDRYAPWDGTYKGKPVKSDVYVWKVVLNRNGDERMFYGHVTVVRGTE